LRHRPSSIPQEAYTTMTHLPGAPNVAQMARCGPHTRPSPHSAAATRPSPHSAVAGGVGPETGVMSDVRGPHSARPPWLPLLRPGPAPRRAPLSTPA
jgi:hypothetical protein